LLALLTSASIAVQHMPVLSSESEVSPPSLRLHKSGLAHYSDAPTALCSGDWQRALALSPDTWSSCTDPERRCHTLYM